MSGRGHPTAHLFHVVGQEHILSGRDVASHIRPPHGSLVPPAHVFVYIEARRWCPETLPFEAIGRLACDDTAREWVDHFLEIAQCGRPLQAVVVDESGFVLEGSARAIAAHELGLPITILRPVGLIAKRAS